MKTRASMFYAAVSAIVALTMSGCDTNKLDALTGTYSAQVTLGDHTLPTLGEAQVTKAGNDRLEIMIRQGQSGVVADYLLSAHDRGLTLVEAGSGLTRELKKTSKKCFESPEGDATHADKLCVEPQEVSLELRRRDGAAELVVIAQRAGEAAAPPENPASYTLDALFRRAVDKSFETRIEFEHVVQAKLAAKNSYLSLLPHISFNTAIALFTFDMAALMGSVGDLAPFLLPNRWHLAHESAHRANAELDADVLTRADAGNLVEGLSYVLLRDRELLKQMKNNHEMVVAVKNEIAGRERLGQLQPGSSDDIRSIVNQMDQDESVLAELLKEESLSVAQAAGFVNPHAITDIEAVVTGTPLSAPNEDDIVDLAILKSPELRQLSELVEASKENTKERLWQWVDPVYDPTSASLGVSLPSYVNIGKSQTRELLIRHDQTQALLRQRAALALAELRQSIDAFKLASAGVDIQHRRVARLRNNLRLGTSIALSDLVNALQDQVRADNSLVAARFAYLIAKSKIDRLIFSGRYDGLDHLKPSQDESAAPSASDDGEPAIIGLRH